MLVWDLPGALILTYFLSRGTLAILVMAIRSNAVWRIAAAHILSWLAIALLLGLLRSNAYYPFMADAGLIYILPQALWFLFDVARIKKASPSRSSRSRSRSASTGAATAGSDPAA